MLGGAINGKFAHYSAMQVGNYVVLIRFWSWCELYPVLLSCHVSVVFTNKYVLIWTTNIITLAWAAGRSLRLGKLSKIITVGIRLNPHIVGRFEQQFR